MYISKSLKWHQIVLSYSSAGTVLFLDGAPAASGPGLAFEPDLATRLADGFTVGSDHNGSGQAGGVFDELATFNCPLAQSDVTANYPYPAILSQPESVTVNNGSTAFFSVVGGQRDAHDISVVAAIRGGTLTNSDRVTGAATNRRGRRRICLTIADVSDADAISYYVVVSNSFGAVTSAVVGSDGERHGATGVVEFCHDQLGGTTGAVAVAGNECDAATGLEHQWGDDGQHQRGAAGVSGCGDQRLGEHQLPGGQRGVVVQPGLEQCRARAARAGDAGRFIELGSYGRATKTGGRCWWAATAIR